MKVQFAAEIDMHEHPCCQAPLLTLAQSVKQIWLLERVREFHSTCLILINRIVASSHDALASGGSSHRTCFLENRCAKDPPTATDVRSFAPQLLTIFHHPTD
jgi:hypothetical protein